MIPNNWESCSNICHSLSFIGARWQVGDKYFSTFDRLRAAAMAWSVEETMSITREDGYHVNIWAIISAAVSHIQIR